jgi:hypothetical protein
MARRKTLFEHWNSLAPRLGRPTCDSSVIAASSGVILLGSRLMRLPKLLN